MYSDKKVAECTLKSYNPHLKSSRKQIEKSVSVSFTKFSLSFLSSYILTILGQCKKTRYMGDYDKINSVISLII